MNAKQFFYVCAGILMLALAYSISARTAEAQSGGQFAGIAVNGDQRTTLAITSSGDVYARNATPLGCPPAWAPNCPQLDAGWQYMGNVLGGTVPIDSKTVGDVKRLYRK